MIYVGRGGPKAYLTSIIDHNRFGVNRECHPSRYNTSSTRNYISLDIALFKLQSILIKIEVGFRHSSGDSLDLTQYNSESLERHINAVKLLLEAGANVVSGFDLIESWLSGMRLDIKSFSNPLLIERVYGQVRSMMREAQAP